MAQGDETSRSAIEKRLPQLEANGWRIAGAVRRIWAGERDWQAICEAEEGVDRNSALLILRILESIPAAS